VKIVAEVSIGRDNATCIKCRFPRLLFYDCTYCTSCCWLGFGRAWSAYLLCDEVQGPTRKLIGRARELNGFCGSRNVRHTAIVVE
jgi:hypothetical protein